MGTWRLSNTSLLDFELLAPDELPQVAGGGGGRGIDSGSGSGGGGGGGENGVATPVELATEARALAKRATHLRGAMTAVGASPAPLELAATGREGEDEGDGDDEDGEDDEDDEKEEGQELGRAMRGGRRCGPV